MGELTLRGPSVLRDGEWAVSDLGMDDGRVAEGGRGEAVDLDGFLVAPGYIDLQCNGGFGIDLATEPERMWELGARLPTVGITAWLATIVSTPRSVVDRAIEALAAGPPEGWRGAVPLGLHLEGPFLSVAKRGAHPEGQLRPPSLDGIERWTPQDGIAVVTMAPELPGALEVVAALAERGVVVSLGHTAATADQARAAIDAGARWVTHLFNAMAPLHHREPGLAGIALSDERVHVGLIPDGIHVHPSLVAVVQRAVRERLTIVSDAVAALGMPSGPQAFGRAEVRVGDSGVRLADGTLAGSNLGLDQGVRNLVAFSGCSSAQGVDAASGAPARLLGDPHRGQLQRGARADLVVLTEDLHLVATYVGGERVHDARGSAAVDR